MVPLLPAKGVLGPVSVSNGQHWHFWVFGRTLKTFSWLRGVHFLTDMAQKVTVMQYLAWGERFWGDGQRNPRGLEASVGVTGFAFRYFSHCNVYIWNHKGVYTATGIETKGMLAVSNECLKVSISYHQSQYFKLEERKRFAKRMLTKAGCHRIPWKPTELCASGLLLHPGWRKWGEVGGKCVG